MNDTDRVWRRINTKTVMVELMGQPAYLYTASNDTDRAVDDAEQYCGEPLDCGEAEEYSAEFAGEEADYPALDGPALPCEFLSESRGSEIFVIPVWV